eukprot:gene8866-11960_t
MLAQQEDVNANTFNDQKFTAQPPFLQRSLSAPAIAEKVSEAVIPTYNFAQQEQEVDISQNLLYPYNNPTRMNPRMPSKRNGGGDLDNNYSDLFNDDDDGKKKPTITILGDEPPNLSNGILSSLINDPKPRTPMDLIQHDFPSTPSSVYSRRINAEARLEQELKDKESKADETSIPPPQFMQQTPNSSRNMTSEGILNSTNSSRNLTSESILNATNDDPVDQATKSFQKLYVNVNPPDISGSNHLMSQNHTPTGIQTNNMRNSSYLGPTAIPPSTSTTSNSLSILSMPLQTGLNANAQSAETLLTMPGNSASNNNGNHSSNLLGQNDKALFRGMGSYMPEPTPTVGHLSGINMNLNMASPPSMTNNHNNTNNNNAVGNMNSNSVLGNNSMSGGYNGLISGNNSNHPNMNIGLQNNLVGMQPIMSPNNLNPNNNGMLPNQQQQPSPYYVQQPVFLDQNGQPMFFRPGPNQQYPPEFIYPGSMDSINMTVGGDPNQQQPAYLSYAAIGQNPGYWNPADQGPMQNGLPMFMNQNGAGVNVNNMVDQSRRMVFNTSTAQYNPMNPSNQRGMGIPNNNVNQMYGINNGMMPPNMMHNQATSMNMPSLLPRNLMSMSDQDGMYHGLNNHTNDERDLYGRKDMSRMNNRDDNVDYNRNNNRYNNGNDRGVRDRDRNNRNNNNNNFNPPNNSGVNPVRDPLVEDFRNTNGKSRQWNLRDLMNHVVAFCQDQHGSRFIQQRLEVCTDAEKQLVFDEIIPQAQSLMTDVFGNYVLQKLFEYGTVDQCDSLATLLKGQAVQLALQMYGCRVVQKALEYVSPPRLIELVQEFENPQLLLRCVHDSNGNHVIQKCIEIVSKNAKESPSPEMSEFLSGRIQFIIVAFHGKVKELSSHPYGCRVVQRILEHCSVNQKSAILEELRQCCTELVQDCYGNYVIQFVMQHGWEQDRAVLIREVQSNLLDFSQHKFASNVVEKCLQYANKKDRDEMIWTIIDATFNIKNPVDSKGHCVLESMVRDPYANYVVQKVIDVSDERQRAAIMRYVKENITQLRRYTYGKHIIVRLEKITNEKF